MSEQSYNESEVVRRIEEETPKHPPITAEDIDENAARDEYQFTERQKAFILNYTGPAAFGNASKAARLSGYAERDTAAGHKLLNNPHIARVIWHRLYGEKGLLTRQDWAESEIRALAGGNMAHFLDVIYEEDVVDEKGVVHKLKHPMGKAVMNWKKVHESGALRFMEEVEFNPDGSVKKFKTSRMDALKIVLKMEGKLKELIDVTGSIQVDHKLIRDPETRRLADALQRRMAMLPSGSDGASDQPPTEATPASGPDLGCSEPSSDIPPADHHSGPGTPR